MSHAALTEEASCAVSALKGAVCIFIWSIERCDFWVVVFGLWVGGRLVGAAGRSGRWGAGLVLHHFHVAVRIVYLSCKSRHHRAFVAASNMKIAHQFLR